MNYYRDAMQRLAKQLAGSRSYRALKKEGKKQMAETTGAESRNEMNLGGEATRKAKESSEKNFESFSCNESCLGLEADCDALECRPTRGTLRTAERADRVK